MDKHHLSTQYITFNPHGCAGCLKCVDACPRSVIGKVRFLWHKHAVFVAPEACVGCGKCVRGCPKGRFVKRVL